MREEWTSGVRGSDCINMNLLKHAPRDHYVAVDPRFIVLQDEDEAEETPSLSNPEPLI